MSLGRRAAVGFVVGIVCVSGIATADPNPPQLPLPPRSVPAAVCDQHTGTTLRQTGPVVVYGTGAGTSALGQTVTRYWACTVPTGRSNWLGTRASGGKYPPNATMRHVTITGTYVAAVDSSGSGATAKCIAADGHFCHRPARAVMLLDATNGASSSTGPATRVSRLLVGTDAASGAAVWTTPAGRGQITISSDVMTTHGDITIGQSGPVTHGPIDPSSLTLNGLRLRYTEHGKVHSVRLSAGQAP
jgi:hypothetical protein